MEAKVLLDDAGNDLVFSVASIWEVAVKHAQDRPDFTVDPKILRRGLLDNRYSELAILGRHALAISRLPPLHKDPFDRILVAQASVEGITLMTSDPIVASYPGSIEQV